MTANLKSGQVVSHYANGNPRAEGAYERGVKVGRWRQYWPNGQLKSDATFHDGLYVGYYCCWHDNGVKQWEGYYNPIRGNSGDGRKEGAWLAYDRETGEVNRVITYRRGARACRDREPPFDAPPVMGPDPAAA